MNLPRRLAEDPTAAPLVACRLRAAHAAQSLPPAVRARIAAALSARIACSEDCRLEGWRSASALALALGVLLALSFGVQSDSADDRQAQIQLRPEPAATPPIGASASAAETLPRVAGRAEPGSAVEQVAPSAAPTAKTDPGRRPSPATVREPAAPAWLIEARAALATNPARTLELIRANRDLHAPLATEVVELTLRALDAQRAAAEP